MTAPRNDEVAAIRVLAELHGPDGPTEWEPHHFDTAEAAASVAARFLTRKARADA